MRFYRILARGSRSYPQPQDLGHLDIVYRDVCPRCSVHGPQISPFRIKRSVKMIESTFLQLNWVFDAFFASPIIAENIIHAGITGISRGAVVDHLSNEEFADRAQLIVSATRACIDVSQLGTVTCRPNNEEDAKLLAQNSDLARSIVGARNRSKAPFCGRVKYKVPTSLTLLPGSLSDAPDIFQTAEWFGSGGLAFRLTLASSRFVEFVRERGWKGMEFHRAQEDDAIFREESAV